MPNYAQRLQDGGDRSDRNVVTEDKRCVCLERRHMYIYLGQVETMCSIQLNCTRLSSPLR
jgi:hypothetical protein